MKIKIAVLDRDMNYLRRLVTAFGTKYSEKLEIYSFTDIQIALSTLATTRIDVFIASEAFEIDTAALPKRCAFAYFVDSPDVDTVNGQNVICRFQKADLIYMQILSLYAEKAGNISGIKPDDDFKGVIAFVSPSGGVGSSTCAAACALHYAAQGKKVLYLDLEKLGVSDVFFSGEGQFDMSDILFALKSNKSNLSLKLESNVRKDPRGVNFYAGTKVALDMIEFSAADSIRLINELKLTGTYEYIIVDMDFAIDKATISLLRAMNGIVLVSDGSELSNSKVVRALDALNILEQSEDDPITAKMKIFYNMFSNKTCKVLTGLDISDIGGVPRYSHATVQEVLTALSASEAFDRIF